MIFGVSIYPTAGDASALGPLDIVLIALVLVLVVSLARWGWRRYRDERRRDQLVRWAERPERR